MDKNIILLIIYIIIIIFLYYIFNKYFVINTISHYYYNIYSAIYILFGYNKCKKINDKIIQCNDGNKNFNCYINDTTITNNIKAGVPWEKFMHKYFKKYSDKNKIALDIGANIGTHTIYLSDYFKEVYAFEPQKNIFTILESNVKLNNSTNIITHNFGLGDLNKKEKMDSYDVNSFVNQGSIGIDKTGYSNGETIHIKILDEMNLDNIKFIKIDVEGYEYNVLKGSKKTIEKSRPFIIIEINIKSIKNYFNILNFFKEINYKLIRISFDDCLAIPLQKSI